jgi:replicative DNA helicase
MFIHFSPALTPPNTTKSSRPAATQEEPVYRIILPQNLEAEQGLLGALMLDNSALEKVSDFLRPFHFFIPVHQRLYEAILKPAERGQIAGPVTLKNYFEKDDDLTHVCGTEYLADLTASVITIINAEDYGRTIDDLYMRRELIRLWQDVFRDAYEPQLEQEHGAMAIIEDRRSSVPARREGRYGGWDADLVRGAAPGCRKRPVNV